MITAAASLFLPFADGTFHAALGSPPYWGGLRVYSGPQVRPWPAISYAPMPGLPPVEIPEQSIPLGHEPDPFAFVGHLLQVFREVRRTLRPEGVLSVNLGDCYSTSPHMANGRGTSTLANAGGARWEAQEERNISRAGLGLPSKNLLLMPWRFALAMQADGWVLRSRMPGGVEMEPDVLWRKSSTMPESVRDRPTVDFEDVLIFAQRSSYYWDQEAGREPYETTADSGAHSGGFNGQAMLKPRGSNGDAASRFYGNSGRNMRAAWTINPEPTDEKHYAAWPVELAARLIRVTTSERGCCPECGAPWERVVERSTGEPVVSAGLRQRTIAGLAANPDDGSVRHVTLSISGGSSGWSVRGPKTSTLGWRPTCPHEAEPVPCRVLDPFAGLGRTWEAARETGRRFTGVDLSLEYCRIARSRSVLEAAERRKAAEAKRVRTIRGPLFEG